MEYQYLGEIRLFAGSRLPTGWAFCRGQLLPITENEALYTLIGTTYGGNGQTTFGLPNLHGRVPIHAGTIAGNSFTLGETGGNEMITLSPSQMPPHVHPINGGAYIAAYGENPGSVSSSANVHPAVAPTVLKYSPTANSPVARTANLAVVNSSSTTTLQVDVAGGSQSFDIRQPYLAVNFIIALEGIYPPQP